MRLAKKKKNTQQMQRQATVYIQRQFGVFSIVILIVILVEHEISKRWEFNFNLRL